MASWDDGKHKNVKKIQIKYGNGRIYSIKVDYESDGKLFAAPRRGGDGGDQLAKIELEKGEYLTSVSGYYNETLQGEVVTYLKFQSNKKAYGPYGTQTRNYFSLDAPKDNQILGFFGSGGEFLSSIEAHVGPITPVDSGDSGSGGSEGTGGTGEGSNGSGGSGDNYDKLGAQGGALGGSVWDDGIHDTVKKIYVGQGKSGVSYIKFEYEKGGQIIGKEHGKMGLLGTEEFELQPDEYLVRVEGFYDKVFGNDDTFIQSIKFVTNKGRVSQPFGLEGGEAFKLDNNGNKIIGFHGRAGDVLYSLGAYTVKSATPLVPADKLEAQGGKAGNAWDDGAHDTVRKIYVGQGKNGIQYVKFVYDNGGKPLEKEHGKKPFIEPEEFELGYPDEYIVRVEGFYDKVFGHEDSVLQSIKFVTNKGRTSQPFGLEGGTPFTLENNGNKIIGFHGTVGEMLFSIGVYTVKNATPLKPADKLEAQGGKAGNAWDDGVYDTVRKIYVGQGKNGIQYVKFVYDNGGQALEKEHGKKPFIEPEEFELQYPDEYLVRVEGFYDKVFGHEDAVLQSIKFVTNKGTISQPFGLEGGTPFTLENSGNKIIGFHGSVGEMLFSIGVYTVKSATPITPVAKKLEAQGGNGGTQWDDGDFDTVKKIFVGAGADGIQYIKFVYEKNGQVASGQDHGDKSGVAEEQFVLDKPNEYLIAVEGKYDNAPGLDTPVIQSIAFKTNLKTSMTYGFEVGTDFSLKEDGSKIVGFHGNANKVIHKLGVYVKPIA